MRFVYGTISHAIHRFIGQLYTIGGLLSDILGVVQKCLLAVDQPKRVKFTNCRQFLSRNFFGLDFHFYFIFLLIGIGQLGNDV